MQKRSEKELKISWQTHNLTNSKSRDVENEIN